MDELVAGAIRHIADFPKPGVAFKDITPLWADPTVLRAVIDWYIACCDSVEFDKFVAFDARGFPFGAILAYQLQKPFIPLRKAGKLPGKTLQQSYALEYGEAVLEMHADALAPHDKVILIDDILATGGTMLAGCQLVEQAGAQVEKCCVVLEIPTLEGREKLPDYRIDVMLAST